MLMVSQIVVVLVVGSIEIPPPRPCREPLCVGSRSQGPSLFACQAVGKAIIDITGGSSLHLLLKKCAEAADSKSSAVTCTKALSTTFLEHAQMMQKPLRDLIGRVGEPGQDLGEALDRVSKLFRCLTHLLSGPQVGQKTTATDVLWFADYTGKSVFEKAVKTSLLDSKKAAGPNTPKGFFQKLIDEAVGKAASAAELQPLMETVETKLATSESSLATAQDVTFLVDSFAKLRLGMRSADLEGLEAAGQKWFVEKAELLVSRDLADVPFVEAVKKGLLMYDKVPGVLDKVAALDKWILENVHAFQAGRLVVFAEKLHDSRKLDEQLLTGILKKCKEGKMTDASKAAMPRFVADFCCVVMSRVGDKDMTPTAVQKLLSLLDKATSLHFSDWEFLRRWSLGAVECIQNAAAAIDALHYLSESGSTAEARLRKDKDDLLMSKVKTCLVSFNKSPTHVAELQEQKDKDGNSLFREYPDLLEVTFEVFETFAEEEIYHECIAQRSAMLNKSCADLRRDLANIGESFVQGGPEDWRAKAQEITDFDKDKFLELADKTLKTVPSGSLKTACDNLHKDERAPCGQ